MLTTSFASPNALICQVASSSVWNLQASGSLDEAASMSSTWMTTMLILPSSERCEYMHHLHSAHLKPQLRKDTWSAQFQMCNNWRIPYSPQSSCQMYVSLLGTTNPGSCLMYCILSSGSMPFKKVVFMLYCWMHQSLDEAMWRTVCVTLSLNVSLDSQ